MPIYVAWVSTKPDGRKMADLVGGKRTTYARLIAAIKLGRPLTDEEVVHHINGNKGDDRFENLAVLPSVSEHTKLHAAELHARRWGGERCCAGCGCAVVERTTNCTPCRARHNEWARAGKPYVPSKVPWRQVAA